MVHHEIYVSLVALIFLYFSVLAVVSFAHSLSFILDNAKRSRFPNEVGEIAPCSSDAAEDFTPKLRSGIRSFPSPDIVVGGSPEREFVFVHPSVRTRGVPNGNSLCSQTGILLPPNGNSLRSQTGILLPPNGNSLRSQMGILYPKRDSLSQTGFSIPNRILSV